MTSRPNLLFIAIDDLNGWIGALGRHPDVKTPNIDALARAGVLFTHAYCAAPHCNPSRTSAFCGLRPSTSGVYHGEKWTVRDPRPQTLLDSLHGVGYRNFGAGKVFHGSYDYETAATTFATHAQWRETHNESSLWDEFHPCADEPLPLGRPLNGLSDHTLGGQELQWFSHFDWGASPAGKLPDERVCEQTEEFLRRSHSEPFFCATGLYRPHLPWYVPQRFLDLYPLESVTLPVVRDDDLADVPAIPRRWASEIPDHERVLRHGQWRHAVQAYLASVSFCDEMVGRVLSALDASAYRDDTIVVLWSDNGFHLGEKLHWRKFTLWEEATRVPLIVRAPGGAQGHREDHPVSLLDLFPTLCELCDAPAPAELEGRSLAPAIRGEPLGQHPLPIATWGRGNHSVRSPRWRYTRYSDASEELYDHANDPHEWTNLAEARGSADIKRELSLAIDAVLARESSA